MMVRRIVVATLIATLLTLASTSSAHQNENEGSLIKDNSQLRFFGGHHQRPQNNGLKVFCERTREWLGTTGANVTASNGTDPSIQELLVDFLTTICMEETDTRSVAQHDEEKRRGWGWNQHNQGGALKAFCQRTQMWLSTTGANITMNNGTDLTIQELFVDFLSTICTDDSDVYRRDVDRRDVDRRDVDRRDDDNQQAVGWRFWGNWFHHRPKPQKAFQIFCERTNEWLSTTGSNVTVVNGTGESITELFIDFLTNICMEDDTRAEIPQKKDVAAERRWGYWGNWGNWGNWGQQGSCLRIFCERTNIWLNTAAANVTSSNNGTELSISELFVNYLTSLCME